MSSIGHSDQYPFATERLAANAGHATLSRVSKLMAQTDALSALDDMHTLSDVARRAEKCLTTAHEADVAANRQIAAMEWTQSLVLMDRMLSHAKAPIPEKSKKSAPTSIDALCIAANDEWPNQPKMVEPDHNKPKLLDIGKVVPKA